MQYRAEVDGLRAVAVLPVILFHAGFHVFSGGFIGVDIFFVISGYLITTIIYNEIKNGDFSIARFYERRIRRIFPSLFFVSLACIPFAWLWMMPEEFKDFCQSFIAVNVFASNILFAMESGYFDAAAELKPLLHTWSLAVEEQFYVIFPIFLLMFYKAGKKSLLILLLALSLISLGLAEWYSTTYPSATFYLLPTRAWELAAGAILAISADTWSRTNGWRAQLGSATGLGLILFAMFTFDEAVPFPGAWALFPVIGTALVIAYARPETVVGKALSWGPLVGIGLISYSAYLWHQPLFAFARIRLLGGVSPAVYLFLSVLSLVLAYFSWRFIEQPFRCKRTFSRNQIFSGAAMASIAIIAFGLVGHFKAGLPSRLSTEALRMSAWKNDSSPFRANCINKMPDDLLEHCIIKPGKEKVIAIWGDSHSAEIAWQLAEQMKDTDISLQQFSWSACIPAPGVSRFGRIQECVMFNRKVFDYLAKQDSVETVVLAGRWTQNFDGHMFDNKEGGIEPGLYSPIHPIGGTIDFTTDEERIEAVGKAVREGILTLVEKGKRVIIVYPFPEVGWDVPLYLAREMLFGVERGAPLSTSYDVYHLRTQKTHQQLDMLMDHPNIISVKPGDLFCDTIVPGRCVAQLADGSPLYFDDDHLNSLGASLLSEKIVARMQEKGWL